MAVGSSRARGARSSSPTRGQSGRQTQQGGGGGGVISPSAVALCLAGLIVVLITRSPNCLGLGTGSQGCAGGGSSSTIAEAVHQNVINQSTADEINRVASKLEKISQAHSRRSSSSSNLLSLFSAANTAFKYHMQQREASFARDRVRPDDKLHWTQAKLREIFLVPVYACPTAIRVGDWGEGGKWLCNIFPFRHEFYVPRSTKQGGGKGMPPGLDTTRAITVYSVGSRDETSFEEAVYKLLNVRPYTMDPSLAEAKQQHLKTLPYIHFYNLGLSGKKKKHPVKSWGPLMRLPEVMAHLKHTYIDVLKIDCESCEIDVMQDLLETFGRKPPIGQVLMEIHHVYIPKVQIDLLLVMEKLGFRMFHSENNERYSKAHEVAYIHESLVDPSQWPVEPALA